MRVLFGIGASWMALTLAVAAEAPRKLPTVDQILANYLRAAGGKAAWERIATQTKRGIALPDFGNLPLEVWAKAPNRWSFQLTRQGGRTIKHHSDGAAAWETAPGLRALAREDTLEESLIYDPFLPLTLKQHFSTLTVRAIEKNGDREVYVVEASPAQGRSKTLYFDALTGLLTRAGKTVYDDYREVDGVKVPFLVRYGWQTLKFSEVKHWVALDAAQFTAPDIPRPPVNLAAEALPSVDQILDRYIAAAGGQAALSKLQTQAKSGSGREGEYTFTLDTIATPRKWLLTLHLGARNEKQGFDGAVAWQQTGEDAKDLPPDDQAEVNAFLQFQLPLRLKELRTALAVKRREKRAERDVYIVEGTIIPGRVQTLRFDCETGLLHSVDSTVFQDYRSIDGVNVPSKLIFEKHGLTITFTDIKHNVPVDDAIFRRPAPGPAFEKVFAGLEDAKAVAVLKRAFGQGVTPSDGRLLYDLIVQNGYKRALDVGTARGYSSLWFALAMKKTGGTVTTIEIDPDIADEARENFRQAGLAGVTDSRINDALVEIPRLRGEFDFVFMDTGLPLNKKFLDLFYARVAPGGAVTAHNADGFKKHDPQYLSAIETDPKLETKIVPTASGGISISLKKK